jgi:hypothetical protein
MSAPLISYDYDQDPRYGWVRVDTGDRKELLFVVDNNGFTYKDGNMEPTCICHAWSASECACPNMLGKWDDWI